MGNKETENKQNHTMSRTPKGNVGQFQGDLSKHPFGYLAQAETAKQAKMKALLAPPPNFALTNEETNYSSRTIVDANTAKFVADFGTYLQTSQKASPNDVMARLKTDGANMFAHANKEMQYTSPAGFKGNTDGDLYVARLQMLVLLKTEGDKLYQAALAAHQAATTKYNNELNQYNTVDLPKYTQDKTAYDAEKAKYDKDFLDYQTQQAEQDAKKAEDMETNKKLTSRYPVLQAPAALRAAPQQPTKPQSVPPLSQTEWYFNNLEPLIYAFEQASRGFDSVSFSGNNMVTASGKQKKRILISGFDPFGQDTSNLSGLVALHFHGQTISVGGKEALVQAVIFPVRYKEFDDNIVENHFGKFIKNGDADAIITISLHNYSGGLSKDRIAANYRKGHADNNNVTSLPGKIMRKDKNAAGNTISTTGADAYQITSSLGILKGQVGKPTLMSYAKPHPKYHFASFPYNKDPSFEHTPGASTEDIGGVQHTHLDQSFKDAAGIDIVPDPVYSASNLASFDPNFPFDAKAQAAQNAQNSQYAQNAQNQTLISSKTPLTEGSGGDFLSNEIYYRVSRLREEHAATKGVTLNTGHWHIYNETTDRAKRMMIKTVQANLEDEVSNLK